MDLKVKQPGWQPAACNICGQTGHQAAHCQNGTINWRAIYGDDAFTIKPPIYYSDVIKQIQEDKQKLDPKRIERDAREFAQTKALQQGLSYEQIVAQAQRTQKEFETGVTASKLQHEAKKEAKKQSQMQQQQQQIMQQLGTHQQQDRLQQQQTQQLAAQQQIKQQPAEGLPEGWAVAYDAAKRPYYWHKKTAKTQWEKPTKETPIN